MFPSNNCNNIDPVYYSDQSILQRPFSNDITPNSKQEDPSLSFFHLLPFEDHDLLLQQYSDLILQQQPLRADNSTVSETVINMVDSSRIEVNGLTAVDCSHKKSPDFCSQQIPMKRPLKRDRHSKINTARGLRDRRMRLSLEVARPFFNLQDKLGYDKASKTVQWLLIQAEPEIRKLERGLSQMNYSFSFAAKSASSTSECEVVSGINETEMRGSIKSRGKPSIKGKKIGQSRNFALRPLTRDMRVKARARARERTSNRMWSRNIDEAKNNDLDKLCSWSFFENGEESGIGSHNRNHSLEVPAKVEELVSHDQSEHFENFGNIFDDSSVIMQKWSPSSIFNCMQNTGIPQEHQLADFQFYGKP